MSLYLFDSCEYEHLDDSKKREIAAFILDHLNAATDAELDDQVNLIIKRRASNGESMEMEEIICEALSFLKLHLTDSFRAALLRHVAVVV